MDNIMNKSFLAKILWNKMHLFRAHFFGKIFPYAHITLDSPAFILFALKFNAYYIWETRTE